MSISHPPEEIQSPEISNDPEGEEIFSIPQETATNEGAYVRMEMVSLETSADAEAMNVHFQVSSIPPENDTTSTNNAVESEQVPVSFEAIVMDNPGQEVAANKDTPASTSSASLSLSRYFEAPEPQPVQDTIGHNFFDSLSSGLSPMMKSVADITSLDIEVAAEAANIEPSVNPNASSNETTPVIETSSQELGTNETLVSEQSLEEVGSEAMPAKPLLSTLFSEDKSGSDVIGKAFFDSLANQANGSSPPGNTDPDLPLSASSGPRSPDMFFLDPQEKDQFYDAWIPSPRTRDVLVAMVTSSQGSFFPERKDLTMPGIIVKDVMADPVKMLMSDLGLEEAQHRSCLTADHVPQDETGLRQLMQAKCFGAAINLTGRLLSLVGQGLGRAGHPSRHSPYSLQLWYTRLALFVKLRKFHSAETESQAFGDLDKPDIYYEFYPDVFTGRKGSMAPFSLRLLLAECPQYQGNYSGALDKLYALLATVQKILKHLENGLAEDGGMVELSEHHRKASLKMWGNRENRVLHAVLNCMVAQKDFAMAIGVAELILKKNPSQAAELHSALGRVYLQLGDVQSASTCFNQVALLRTQQPPSVKHSIEDLVHKALMCIVQNGYADAYKFFNDALTLDPGNPVLTNNMSVCLLYMGRLKEALALVEGTVMQGAATESRNLHEGLLFNMCILYELESFHNDKKKLSALKTVGQKVGDAFQTACLKIDVKAFLERK